MPVDVKRWKPFRSLLFVFVAGFCCTPALAEFRFTSPQEGERWAAGSTHRIVWTYGEEISTEVPTIEYSVNAGQSWSRIPTSAGDRQNVLLTVPDRVGTTCLIRATTHSAARSTTVQTSFVVAPSQKVKNYQWVKVTDKAAFAPRDGAGALVFRARMWFLGGWNPSDKKHFPRICNNEVWSSSDGAKWTLVKPNTFLDRKFDPKSDWEGRHTAGYAVYRDKMWIVGGDANQGHYQNDVWNSSDGKKWNLVAAGTKIPWAPRALHLTVTFQDALWVIGGQTMPAFAGAKEKFYRDIWKSTDGVKWKRIEPKEPCWSPRGMIGGSVVLNGRIWILGGGTYDTPTTPKRNFYNDVWSTADGVRWKRHVEHAPWHPRQYHDVAAFDGRMWVLEGYHAKGGNRKDVWYSADGENWYEVACESLESRVLLSANALSDISQLNDEFDDATTLADWQRVNEVEGWNADQLQQFNIDSTQSGRLVMQPHTVVWYEDWRGPMAFKEVTGDFVYTTQIFISDRDDIGDSDADDVPDDAAFSLGGLMIRTPRNIVDPSADWQPGSRQDDGTNNGENYVFLSMGHATDGQFSFEVKSTRNSNSQLELTPLGQNANSATLRIARVGDAVITMYQLPGQDWTIHRRIARPDMPETLQLGLVTYSDWNKASDFDPFVHNSSVLETGIADPTPVEAFNPDLVAGFEYVRFDRPEVPAELEGVDLINTATDEQLLSFLGDQESEGTEHDFNTPELDDQNGIVGGSAIVIDLAGFNPGNNALTYEVSFVNLLAQDVMNQHHLHEASGLVNYALNWGGENEKWVQGDQGWYFLLPDGSLNVWNGSFANSTEIADFSEEVYENPQLLLDGESFGMQAEVVDGELILTPGEQVGDFAIALSLTDSVTTDQAAFTFAFGNTLPTVDISDQTATTGQPLVIELPLQDADGHAISYNVKVEGGPLHMLDAEHGFWSTGEYYDNYHGQNERWIRDHNNQWYYLLENGDLYRWEGSIQNSVLIAELGTEVYDDPSLLTDPEPLPISITIENGVLTILAEEGFVGEVTLLLTADDGYEDFATSFQVVFEVDLS
eukprot:g21428.t1